jgi:AraC-like DNA-binding protein
MALPFLSVPVHPELSDLVAGINLSPDVQAGSHTVFPGPFPVLGFQLEGRMRIATGNAWRPLSPAGITGICTRQRVYDQTASTRTVLIRLMPWSLPVIFGESAFRLTDKSESLQDLLPSLFKSIVSGTSEAIVAAEANQELLIRQRRRSNRVPNIIAIEGARSILRSDGKVRVGELEATLGWSRRHLERTFLNEIGLTPKEFAGIVRFRRAEKALKAGRRFADVALEVGYYDQAHLANDIKRYSGTTPSRIR